MKSKNLALLVLGVLTFPIMFTSCLNTDEPDGTFYPNALVTIKSAPDNPCYLQLDDSTTLFPTNIKTVLYNGKEVRALSNIREVDENPQGHDKAVHVNWIDTILTKPAVPSQGEADDNLYGADPIDLIGDWVNVAEDGYLTLHFRFYSSGGPTIHYVNLITGVNPGNPYEMEFRHNANGDIMPARYTDGIVAFRLSDLPDTEGKTVKLKVNWKSPEGNKSVEFKYKSKH